MKWRECLYRDNWLKCLGVVKWRKFLILWILFFFAITCLSYMAGAEFPAAIFAGIVGAGVPKLIADSGY